MGTSRKVGAAVAALALLLMGAFLAFRDRPPVPAPEPTGSSSADRESVPAVPTLAAAPRRSAPSSSPAARVDVTERLPKNVREGAAAGKGVVGGVVRDGDELPLAGAEVLLWDEAGRSVLQRLTTTEGGRFRFDALEDGVHRLSVHRRGKASLSFRAGVGERLLDVMMEAAPRITGVVLEQGTDRPVEGVSVLAQPQGPMANAHDSYAKTAKDGTFMLDDLTAGSWLLNVGQFSITAEGPEAEYVRRRVGPVEAGAPALRVELLRGLAISGEIRGPDGAPWTAGASLRASPLSEAAGVGYEWQRVVNAGADGTFRIPGLSRGAYDVTVDTPATGGGAAQAGLIVSRRVTAGTTGLVIDLLAGRAIEGRLVDETGAAVTAPGWLWVYEMGSFAGAPGSISVKVGQAGKFVSPALDPGRAYVVRGMGFEGFGPGELSGVRPGDPGVVVKLFRGRQISGRVVDAHGRPITEWVPVTARIEKQPETVRPDDGSYVDGSTDTSGNFKIGGLQEGEYTLDAGGFASGWVSLGMQHGVLPSASPVVLRVERGVPLSGRLLDAAGDGIAYASVQAAGVGGVPGALAFTSCDAEGKFKFAGVRKGPLVLSATIDGKYVELGRFEAPAEDLTVRLPK